MLSVSRLTKISTEEVKTLLHRFNQEKFVIIQTSGVDDPRYALHSLTRIFGAATAHHRADKLGIVTITPIAGETDYLSASSQEHFFHTDGAFTDVPPLVAALLCVRPARIGGVSRILYAKDIYKDLIVHNPTLRTSLERPDAITVSRRGQTASHPIFRSAGGRLRMVYRDDLVATTKVVPEALDAFAALRESVRRLAPIEFLLDANQVLVMDNSAVLHARTAFIDDDPRLLYRIDMDGQSTYSSTIEFGFNPLV